MPPSLSVLQVPGVQHPKRKAWEDRLARLLTEVDIELERRHGDAYPLHPARARHGETSNPKYSGLFQISAQFSPGYGSRHGRGYVVEVRMVTLSTIPDDTRNAIESEAAELIRARLPDVFPGRTLDVQRDGPVYKLTGDFSLGTV